MHILFIYLFCVFYEYFSTNKHNNKQNNTIKPSTKAQKIYKIQLLPNDLLIMSNRCCNKNKATNLFLIKINKFPLRSTDN